MRRTGLIPREIDVPRLLADGNTNRQIAEHLFITQKTAEHHVSWILAKLAASNRNQAVAAADRLGLTTLPA